MLETSTTAKTTVKTVPKTFPKWDRNLLAFIFFRFSPVEDEEQQDNYAEPKTAAVSPVLGASGVT